MPKVNFKCSKASQTTVAAEEWKNVNETAKNNQNDDNACGIVVRSEENYSNN